MFSITSNPARGHGVYTQPFIKLGVNRHSRVVGSITEIAQPPGEPLDFPFIGDAQMQILNIAPEDDGNVWLRISIGWDSDLNYRVTLFVDP